MKWRELIFGIFLVGLCLLPASSTTVDTEGDLNESLVGTHRMRAPGWSGEAVEEEVGPQILVKKVILSINGSTVKYKIEVTNSGTTTLSNVNVTDVLPDGMDYNEGNSRMISTEEINAKFPPVTSPRQKIPTQEDYEAEAEATEPAKMSRGSSDTTKTPDWNLTWKIEKLETSDTQNIYLNVTNPSEDVKKAKANRVYAEGTWLYGNITVSDVAPSAIYPKEEG